MLLLMQPGFKSAAVARATKLPQPPRLLLGAKSKYVSKKETLWGVLFGKMLSALTLSDRLHPQVEPDLYQHIDLPSLPPDLFNWPMQA